jgi:hypothetical protein
VDTLLLNAKLAVGAGVGRILSQESCFARAAGRASCPLQRVTLGIWGIIAFNWRQEFQ